IAAYLGQEGWSLGCDLRIGSQHSQKEFILFLKQVVGRAKQILLSLIYSILPNGNSRKIQQSPKSHSIHSILSGKTTQRDINILVSE
ncbi:MAG: hypothetical protein KAG53_06385, partial [Endozoicomonadaceae bacterium]|nr:hypothetical protein [Endozoicomonadaceae bacterium]